MKPFEESMRLDYPLTKDSVVLEIGAYKGRFTEMLDERFGCMIHSCEPVIEFFNECVRKFQAKSNIHLWPFALGASNRTVKIGVKGDMSGEFCGDTKTFETIPMLDVVSFAAQRRLYKIDLVVINCEGGEFELLERMIESGLVNQCDNVCIQWHGVGPDPATRRDAILKGLIETHGLTFDAEWIWQNWRRK